MWNRQQGVDDARAQVTGRVDGVSGGSAERQTDADDQEGDDEDRGTGLAESLVRPKARIGRTRPIVAMISVTRFATGLRIAGAVEKIPSVGWAMSSSALAWNCAK